MEVFISWSGDRSGKVAEALRDWLPSVIQSVTPFMSASDIETGSRWPIDLSIHLEQAQFGLICLTQENLEAPWLLFEAGALSKSIENSRVVPYLYGVSQAQLQGPLAQFQAAFAKKDSTLEVVRSINGASAENALEPTRLERAFETWWPHLNSILDNIPETTEKAPPSRTDRDILEEILRLTRQMSRQSAPNFEHEQEIFRNIAAHGLSIEPADSTEDLDAENLQLPADRVLQRAQLEHQRREHQRREHQRREHQRREHQRREHQRREHQRREHERQERIHQRILESHPHAHLSSESEAQSSNDNDNDAKN